MKYPVKYVIVLCGGLAALALASCKQEQAVPLPSAGESAANINANIPPATIPGLYYFQCGDTLVKFNLGQGGTAAMNIANVSYALQQVVTASGVKYENLGDATTYLWNKGDTAFVHIDGQALPDCQKTTAPVPERRVGGDPIRDRTWVLVRMNDAEPIAGHMVTLTLAADGGVSGRGGCNRYMGQYSMNGEVLSLNENIASTMMACVVDGVMEQEGRYLKILAAMNKITRAEDGTLHLSGADNQSLTYREE